MYGLHIIDLTMLLLYLSAMRFARRVGRNRRGHNPLGGEPICVGLGTRRAVFAVFDRWWHHAGGREFDHSADGQSAAGSFPHGLAHTCRTGTQIERTGHSGSSGTNGGAMFDLEIRKPSKQTVVGFVIGWVCVICIMLLTTLIARVGAT